MKLAVHFTNDADESGLTDLGQPDQMQFIIDTGPLEVTNKMAQGAAARLSYDDFLGRQACGRIKEVSENLAKEIW